MQTMSNTNTNNNNNQKKKKKTHGTRKATTVALINN